MEHRFEAIGTAWSITTTNETGSEDIPVQQIRDRIDAYDQNYSRFRSDSLVSALSQAPGTYALPDDAEPLFDLYRDLYTLTDGAFTPLIGTALVAAGYDATYSLIPADIIPTPPSWNDALEYNFPALTIKQPVLIDVGAAGKGHLIDIVADMLMSAHIESFTINAGGDIYSHGTTQQIALEDPNDTTHTIGVVNIQNESLCGSAGNRRIWDKYHHIINPHTRTSPRDISAVWVTAKNTILADALSTCLFFVPPEILTPRYQFEYLILYPDRSVHISPSFSAQLFS